ncbi:hypothetical protein CBR_g50400 [Chara braunii]|uniref:Uncharacterized protein n=1 Tax=Chara braunii TaxID=69332 RepID=A0A388M6P0_CHABU|nr:hypothetical protein CBR_g50400 [Chara braunii]|eukprot:GBG90221.1 hypothetical protein CBR_g50400 [Chara braunii]
MEEAPTGAAVQRGGTSQAAGGTTSWRPATSTMTRQQRAAEGGGSGSAVVAGATLEAMQPRLGGLNVEAVAGTLRGPSGGGRREEEVNRQLEGARLEKRNVGGDDEPLANRVRKGGVAKDLAERTKLLYNIIHETKEYLVAIASGLPLLELPKSVAMPKSNVTQIRLTDAGQLQETLSRAGKLQNVALHVLHGWVFKSGSRARGYTVTFQYALESLATDIARTKWHGEEWSDVISPAVCAHTLDLGMDPPLWFARVHIEDGPDDDDMAAYQEATVMRLVATFSTAVETGQTIDNGCITHDHLSRVAESFRLLLAACMWKMRMAGDNLRSHSEAFYFANILAKPLLVASMHRMFDHCRHIVSLMNAVTERLGKAQLTLGHFPNYIPEWASCDIFFHHDANLSSPDDVRRLEWLGTGPPGGGDDYANDDDG